MAAFILFVFIMSLYRGCVLGNIVLTNNSYTGLQIVISSSISEDPTLITRLKEIFTDASAYLFNATKYRAYFGSIDIIVPENWTSVTVDETTSRVNTSSPYVLVDTPHPRLQDNPYVRLLECGKPGMYMHLTTGFINSSNSTFGDHGRVIVHEWGHLRWGLFDEYPSLKHRGTKEYIRFYKSGGQNHPVMCSKEIKGDIEIDEISSGLCNLKQAHMDPACRFVPHTDQSTRASIMAYQWINSVTDFCDNANDESVDPDLRHDPDATNLQNILCDGKSAWEVIREHEDFSNGNNPPDMSITDTSPTFRILRKTPKIRVMVFDVSGSMGWTSVLGNPKINEQAQAAEYVIQNIVETGSYLALVSFSSYASTLAGLTEIDSEQTKDALRAKVPRYAGGGTYIDRGLSQAVSIISSSSIAPTEGVEIILLSDGVSIPYLYMVPTLINLGITVHSIAITNYADADMSYIAHQTGGRIFTYLETTSITFADVFTEAIKSDDATQTSVQQVFGKVYSVSSNSDPITGSFIIDDGLGKDTKMAVMLPSSRSVSIDVIGPQGTSYSHSETEDFVTLLLDSGNQVQTGSYSFQISVPASFYGTVEVRVSSSPSSDNAEVIQVSSKLSSTTIDFDDRSNQPKVFVTVSKKHNPVLNANVTLVLSATSSNNGKSIQAYDSGTGADSISDDGVYSAYLSKRDFTENSNYNIKVLVNGDETTSTYSRESSGRASPLPGTEEAEATTVSVGSFERTSVTEEITVTNFQSNPPDTTPPAKITDLISDLVVIESINGTFYITYTFTWTAVGSDLDIGQATAYEMRYHNNNGSFVRNNFSLSHEIPASMPSPQPSGTTETINITFTQDDCNGTCYIGIRAQDENNLNGTVSNIATIDIDFTYSFDTSVEVNVQVNVAANNQNGNTNTLLIALLVSVPIIVIIGVVLVWFILYKHHSTKKVTGRTLPDSNVDPKSALTKTVPDKTQKLFVESDTNLESILVKTNLCRPQEKITGLGINREIALVHDPSYNHKTSATLDRDLKSALVEVKPCDTPTEITDKGIDILVVENTSCNTTNEIEGLDRDLELALEAMSRNKTPLEFVGLDRYQELAPRETPCRQTAEEFVGLDTDAEPPLVEVPRCQTANELGGFERDQEPALIDPSIYQASKEFAGYHRVPESALTEVTAYNTQKQHAGLERHLESPLNVASPYNNQKKFIGLERDPFKAVKTMFKELPLKEVDVDDTLFSTSEQNRLELSANESESVVKSPLTNENVCQTRDLSVSTTSTIANPKKDMKIEDILDVEEEREEVKNTQYESPQKSFELEKGSESSLTKATSYKELVGLNRNPFGAVKIMFQELPLQEIEEDDNIFSIAEKSKVEIFYEEAVGLSPPCEGKNQNLSATPTHAYQEADLKIEDVLEQEEEEAAAEEQELVICGYDTLSVKSGKGLWFTEIEPESSTDYEGHENISIDTLSSTIQTGEQQIVLIQLNSPTVYTEAIDKDHCQTKEVRNDTSQVLYSERHQRITSSPEEELSKGLDENSAESIEDKPDKYTQDFHYMVQHTANGLPVNNGQYLSYTVRENGVDQVSTEIGTNQACLDLVENTMITYKPSSDFEHQISDEQNVVKLRKVDLDKNVAFDGNFVLNIKSRNENAASTGSEAERLPFERSAPNFDTMESKNTVQNNDEATTEINPDLNVSEGRQSTNDTTEVSNGGLNGSNKEESSCGFTMDTDEAIKYLQKIASGVAFVHPKPPEKTGILFFDEGEDDLI